MGGFTIVREDWSLHRKGEIDRQRHQEKVKEAIKNNLADVVSEESIIMADGKKVIKVPIRALDEFHFRFDRGKQKHVGQGDGKNKSKVGDIVASEPYGGKGSGKGKGAGEEPGVDYYEAEVTIDEIAEIIFADLNLPNLKPRKRQQTVADAIEFKDVRKMGISSNIDRRRTLLEALKRNLREGRRGIDKIIRDDLRYKTWDESRREDSNAVVIAMLDTSGSMGPYEKYIARSFFFWMVRFLRTRYHNVQIVFLAHHVEAKETTEEEFFSKGASGGTRCSSVYKLALDIIRERFNPQDYNIYAFHFSDGDNLVSDNEQCVRLIEELLKVCSLVGYGEIEGPYYYANTLKSVFKKINDPKFVMVSIKDKSEVYTALKTFFRSDWEQN